jgi:hypothetical protein
VTFNPSGQVWTPIASKADQFAIGGTGIFALAWDHGSVWQHGSGTNWNAIGGAADELFAGGPSAGFLAATTLDQYKNIVIYSTGTTWIPQGGSGYMFAVVGNDFGTGKQLLGMLPTVAGGAVYKSNSVTSPNPGWFDTWTPALPPARIVAGPRTIYATVGVDYTTY